MGKPWVNLEHTTIYSIQLGYYGELLRYDWLIYPKCENETFINAFKKLCFTFKLLGDFQRTKNETIILQHIYPIYRETLCM